MFRFFHKALAKPLADVVRNTSITVASSGVATAAYHGARTVAQVINQQPTQSPIEAENSYKQTNCSA